MRDPVGRRAPVPAGGDEADRAVPTILSVRVLGIDFGLRRLGLALSDGMGLLARPWQTVPAGATPAASAAAVAELLSAGGEDAREVGAVVVGLPRRLNGEETHVTPAVRAFADALGGLTGLPVHLQDERLTSHEAESQLAARERDWRVRKKQIDAAAAAIILQDYLDARQPPSTDEGFPV
jgi:putative Holliday junction resolvase